MRTHRVRPGDRLSTISQLTGVPSSDIVRANPGKLVVQLASGAVVFQTLSVGEDLALPPEPQGSPLAQALIRDLYAGPSAGPTSLGVAPPGACPSGQAKDGTGTCHTIADLNAQCLLEGLAVVDEASDYARAYKFFKQIGLIQEAPHYEPTLAACTQLFYPAVPKPSESTTSWAFKDKSGHDKYFVNPPQRRTWAPTVPLMAYVTPTTGSSSNPLTSTPSCPPTQVWSASQQACVPKAANPCKKGQHLKNGKCVGPSGTTFGPDGTSPPAIDARHAGAPRPSAQPGKALGSFSEPSFPNPDAAEQARNARARWNLDHGADGLSAQDQAQWRAWRTNILEASRAADAGDPLAARYMRLASQIRVYALGVVGDPYSSSNVRRRLLSTQHLAGEPTAGASRTRVTHG